MLQTRLLVGTILALGGLGVLVADEQLAPWHPGWLLIVLALGLATCHELFWLVGQSYKFASGLSYIGVVVLLSMNWLAHMPCLPAETAPPVLWLCFFLLMAFIVYFFSLFLVEMAYYRQPDAVMVRMSLSLWMVAYLGLLPTFLVQLRWLSTESESPHAGTMALILAIFVPKCCDIGAYFTGRWFGRNRMSPAISPKKTWEGALGGLVFAALVSVIIDQFGPVSLLHRIWWAEVGFGVTVGGAGILGDLAESMIKRDCNQKDASQVVPGFGGVLDVIDAVLFAAPVACLWLALLGAYLQ